MSQYKTLHYALASRAYPDQWASDWSEELKLEAARDLVAPLAPSGLAAAAVPEGARLEWTNPILNSDGTTCYDLATIKVYYKSTSGVTKASNDGSFLVGPGERFVDRSLAASTQRYYVVTAIDETGNESDTSSEVDATASAIDVSTSIPDDATGLIFDDTVGTEGVLTGDGILGIVFKVPDTSWVSFDHYRLWYAVDTEAGFGGWTEIGAVSQWAFIHKNLTTTYAYKYKATVVATDGTESSTPDEADNSGVGFTPNADDNLNVVDVVILAQLIIATDEVRAEHIKASTITADKLSFTAFEIGTHDLDDVGDGTTYSRVLTTDISAGHIKLSESIGDLDDVGDGTTYSRVLTTDISAGHIKLSETVDDSTHRLVTDSDITQWNSAAPGDLDGLPDGTTYSRVLTTDISAGHIKLSESIGDLDDIANGTYAKVLATDIDAGHIKLSETVGDLDDIDNGSTYGKVALTDIDAGHITVVASDASININSATFGVDGIQLQYNAGNPRAYIGNGASQYVKFDGTKITWKAANSELDASGNLVVTSATISGAITITSGSGISNLSDAGTLATLDNVGASNCNTTIISGGKIITGLLTASNIQTGTLNASVVTVTNLSASNITAGTLDVARLSNRSITAIKIGLGAITDDELHDDAVTYGKIAANAVRTNELYVDGNVTFAANGTRHYLFGVTGVHYGTSGASNPSLYMNANSVWLQPTSSGNATIISNNSYNAVKVYNSQFTMVIDGTGVNLLDTSTTGGRWGYGYIKITVGGTTRYIHLGQSS